MTENPKKSFKKNFKRNKEYYNIAYRIQNTTKKQIYRTLEKRTLELRTLEHTTILHRTLEHKMLECATL